MKYKLDKPLEFDRILWSLLLRWSLLQLEQMILEWVSWVLEQSTAEVAQALVKAVLHALGLIEIEIELLLLDEKVEIHLEKSVEVEEALVLVEFPDVPEVTVVVLFESAFHCVDL